MIPNAPNMNMKPPKSVKVSIAFAFFIFMHFFNPSLNVLLWNSVKLHNNHCTDYASFVAVKTQEMLPPRVAFLMCMLIILQSKQCSGQGSMGDDNYGDTGAHTMDLTEYTCANCIIGKSIPFLCSGCVSGQSEGPFTCGRCSLLREFFNCRRCRARNPDFGDNFSVDIMETQLSTVI